MIWPMVSLPSLGGPEFYPPPAPRDWRPWLNLLFGQTFQADPASYHIDFWEWVWEIKRGTQPRPWVGVWPRGWAKSTCAEVAAVMLGATGRRRYIVYGSETQAQADDHVQTIAGRLASSTVERYYPDLATRRVGKYGASLGWRRNRLRTAAGVTIDALGLDTASRGIKLDDERPDCIVLDDIDNESDGVEVVNRKERAVTQRLLPAGSPDVAVLVVQNLVHRNGIVSRLVDGRADWLGQRILSGPHPAITGLETEGTGKDALIVAGTPTWTVMGLEQCQAKIRLFGLSAFRAECQHEVELAGQPRFDLDALRIMREAAREPLPGKGLPAKQQGIEGLRVYTLPEPGAAYVMYIDPAEGKGRDYTVTVVMDARRRQVVVVLEDNTREPQAHGELAADLYEWYHHPLVCWERAKGEAITHVLGQRGVDRVYQHEDNPLRPQQRQLGRQPVTRPGFPMTEHSKRGLIDRLGQAIESHAVGMPDKRMVEQCENYVVTEAMKTQAAVGGHDDLVIGVAGCLMLSEAPGAQGLGRGSRMVTSRYHEANPRVKRR